MKVTVFRILIFAFLVTILGCAGSKKNTGKTSWFSQKYHNLTAKYNGYFNANEIYNESLDKLKAQHIDNYTKPLPVYDYIDEGAGQAVGSELDKAIKKASIVIELHRKARWTDDAYFLIGKSHFLKQEYETAEEVFTFIEDAFNPDFKKRKSVKLNPKEKAEAKKKELEEKQKLKDDASREKELEKYREQRYKEDAKKAKENERKEKIEERKDIAKAKQKEREELAKSREKDRKQKEKERLQRLKEAKRNKAKGIKSTPAPKVAPSSKPTVKPSNGSQSTQSSSTTKAKDSPKVINKNVIDYSKPVTYEKEKPIKEEKVKYQIGKDGKTNKKPKNYFWKHRPCYQESKVWLARTYTARKKYEEAEFVLKGLIEDPTTFKDVLAQAYEARAHNDIQTENYSNAISSLQSAIELKKHKKEQRARMNFIIGQLYQIQKEEKKASDYFALAAKSTHKYEMAFNASLYNIIWKSTSQEDGYPKGKKELETMSRESKNKEFLPDIYYALGDLAIKNQDLPTALESFKKSSSLDTKNSPKKTESCFQLAHLYFEKEEYLNSKNYFDTTASLLLKGDIRAISVKTYQSNLTEIASNITIIQMQDSLLKVSSFSDKEKRALAVKLKKDAAMQSEPSIGSSSLPKKGQNTPKPAANPNAPKSSFFAYDEKDLKKGIKDFKNKWGDRKLEDNWRRSSKRNSVSYEDNNQIASTESSIETQIAQITDQDLESLFAGVPYSIEAKKIANEKIAKAWFNLGNLYQTKLQNIPKSIQAFEALLAKTPGSIYEAETLYKLYSIYVDKDENSKAKSYLDLLLQKHPQSTFAQAIVDPDFIKRRKSDLNKESISYDSAYTHFDNERYAEAFDICTRNITNIRKEHKLLPKFALLSAMCTGKLKGESDLLLNLKDLIAKYPNTEEQKRAREIMRLLGQRNTGPASNITDPLSIKFKLDPNDQHLILIIITDKDISLNDAKARIADYNSTNFQLSNLQVSNMFLGKTADTRTPIVVVRRFANKTEAMKYYDLALKDKAAFLSDKVGTFEMFAIGQNNYRVMVDQDAPDLYRDFFIETYLTD